MKTLITILITTLTLSLSAQSVMVPDWLIKVTHDIADMELFQEIEINGEHIYIKAREGDRIALWDNSGVVVFDVTFQREQNYQLDLGYLLSGVYHIGVKKAGDKGKRASLEITGNTTGTVAVLKH